MFTRYARVSGLPSTALLVPLVLLVTLASLSIAPALLAADDPPAVQFAADAPLSVAWVDGQIVAALQNNTTDNLTVAVRLEAFTGVGAVIEASALTTAPALTVTLPAAGSVHVSFPLRTLRPAPGRYDGFVTAVEQIHNLVVRKPVVLTVSNPAAVAPLIPALTSFTVRAYRLSPFSPLWCVYNCALPLQGEPENQIAPAGALGYLLGDHGGALRVSAGPFVRDGGLALIYGFTGNWGAAGSYTGQVDLAPTDAANGAIALTVNVADAIWIPILLLIIGVMIVAWTQNWLGVRRPLWELVRREASASEIVQQSGPVCGYDIRGDAAQQLTEIRSEAQALDRIWLRLLFDPADVERARQDHARIEQRLAAVEAQLDLWQKWPFHLAELERALLQAATPAIEQASPPPILPASQTSPAFFDAALALTRGKPSTLAELERLADVVAQATRLARCWGAWEQRLAGARAQLDLLADLTPPEARMVERARQQANSAWADLWTAHDLSALTAQHTEEEIAAVIETVHRLLHRLPAPTRGVVAKEPGAPSAPRGVGVALPGYAVTDLPAAPAARAQRAQQALHMGDRAFLGIAIVVALAGGLNELYFDKNFGSLADWLQALTWGAGTKLGVDLVKSVLERLFKR